MEFAVLYSCGLVDAIFSLYKLFSYLKKKSRQPTRIFLSANYYIRLHYVTSLALCSEVLTFYFSKDERRGFVKGKELKNYKGVLNMPQGMSVFIYL